MILCRSIAFSLAPLMNAARSLRPFSSLFVSISTVAVSLRPLTLLRVLNSVLAISSTMTEVGIWSSGSGLSSTAQAWS